MSGREERSDAGADLLDTLARLGAEEKRVMLVLARRLLMGQQTYGRLDLASDARDWRRERADELADALVYGAIAEVANEIAGQPQSKKEKKETVMHAAKKTKKTRNGRRVAPAPVDMGVQNPIEAAAETQAAALRDVTAILAAESRGPVGAAGGS